MQSTGVAGKNMARTTVIRVTLAVVLLALIAAAYLARGYLDPAAMERWVDGLGPLGPVLFTLIYAVATVLFFPGAILTLLGGALFGPILGTFYNLAGATIGATIAFLIARHLAADWVEAKAGERTKHLIKGVEAEGWRFVAFVRLVPLFPFNLLNYALGLTRIRTLHYIVSSYIFMLPGAIAYTYLGYAGRELAAGTEGTIQKILLAIALLSAVAFLPRFIARLRRGPTLTIEALKNAREQGHDITVLDVRSPEEFSGELGHVAAAINIPINELSHRVRELDAWVERPLAIMCRTDRRSAKAARLLAQQGFAHAHVVQGGMTAWNDAGLPIER